MLITFEDRPSDSPIVDRIWRSHSERAGIFHSIATCNWGMVVTRHEGKTSITVRGPETHATFAECPAEGEWIGVQFKVGTFMPLLPTGELRDRNDVTLPGASRSFTLNGSRWEYPTYENIETFVQRLVQRELIVQDPYVQNALGRGPLSVSQRTEQRRFRQVTGITQSTIRQIERARRATLLLRAGDPIEKVVHELCYFDQAHLTRSLKRFIGQTPAQISRGESQLSLLYNPGET